MKKKKAQRTEPRTRCNMGEDSPSAKLKEEQVREIRALIGTMPQKVIAINYGVSPSLISMIKSGKVWDCIL